PPKLFPYPGVRFSTHTDPSRLMVSRGGLGDESRLANGSGSLPGLQESAPHSVRLDPSADEMQKLRNGCTAKKCNNRQSHQSMILAGVKRYEKELESAPGRRNLGEPFGHRRSGRVAVFVRFSGPGQGHGQGYQSRPGANTQGRSAQEEEKNQGPSCHA